jgi:hypothetical protein
MCMALERRVHVLLDEERYQRVAAVAKERNSSVGAVIRDAIDKAVPDELALKRAAWERIRSAPLVPAPEPEELKAELDELRSGGH